MYRFLVTATLQPGKLPAVVAAAKPFAEATRSEPGCLAFDMYAHFDGSDSLAIVEAFENHAAHAAHEASDHFKTFMTVFRPSLMDGKVEPIADGEAD